jgi:peptidoglycan glycosyltransferase
MAMNRKIRRLTLGFTVLYLCLFAFAAYYTVLDAGGLQARADNPRTLHEQCLIQRGLITDRHGMLLGSRTTDAIGCIRRVYPDPSLAAITGYYDTYYGVSDLEASANGFLSGQQSGGSWDQELAHWEHRTIVGDNLSLTLDDRLQRQVEAIMPNAPSAAVVADPHTGELLAMVSKPHIDVRRVGWQDRGYMDAQMKDASQAPLLDRVTLGYYPPGSTFKLVTLAGVLDSRLATLNTLYSGRDAVGPIKLGKHTLTPDMSNLAECGQTPPITLTTALACSDNITFGVLGLQLGQKRWLHYARAFGLDSAPPLDIPVAPSTIRARGVPFDAYELAASAFGQGHLRVTPLQMLMITEAFANGGRIPRPILVRRITGPDGSAVEVTRPRTLYRPIPPAIADQVRAAMVQVVNRGSGYAAQIPGVQVAGKTGTAQVPDAPPDAWFVGFAPADHPRVAVAVIWENAGEGAQSAAPLAGQILRAALRDGD